MKTIIIHFYCLLLIIPGIHQLAAKNATNQTYLQGFQALEWSGYDVAEAYTALTGKRVLVGSKAGQATVQIIQPGPFKNLREATIVFEKLLLIEGLTLVDSAENEVKLVLSQDNPKAQGIPLIIDIKDIYKDVQDKLVHYLMTFNHIQPIQAQEVFSKVIGNFNPNEGMVMVESASALLITANTALIRNLNEIKERIDISGSETETKFFDIIYADSEVLADDLLEILDESNDNGTSGGSNNGSNNTATTNNIGTRPANVNDGTGNSNTGNISSVRAPAVKPIIKPIIRNNRLLIIARPVDLIYLESLIIELDAKPNDKSWFEHKLKFIAVNDFISIAQDALERIYSDPASISRSSSNTGSTQTTTGSSSTSSDGGSSLADPTIDEAPQSVLVGKTQLIADNISNTLIVNGPPEGIRIISELIDRMDTQPDRVAITVIFGRYTTSDDKEFSVDFSRALQGIGSGGIAGSLGSSPLDVGDLTDITTFSAQDNGLSLYGLIGNRSTMVIKALESTNRFEVISRPTIHTTNNRKAVISAGQSVAVPTNTFQDTTNTNSFNTNYEYRDVLLKLEVIAQVNSNDEVTLDLAIINDNISGSDTIGSISNIPRFATEELTTTITVPNGESVVLGGLISQSETTSEVGVPIIRHIPLIGGIFEENISSKEKNELIIFVQPTIIKSNEHLREFSKDIDYRNQIFSAEPQEQDKKGDVTPTIKDEKTR